MRLALPIVLGFVLATLLGACTTTGDTERYKQEDVDLSTAAELNAKLGLAYLQQGNRKRALEKMRHALDLDPQRPITHHYIAELYRQLGQYDLAEEHFMKAIELDPKDANTQNDFGVFLCDQGRHEEGVKRFLNAIKDPLYDTPGQAYENAAICVLDIPDRERAEKYFRLALRENPFLPTALYRMAEVSFNEGQYFRARAFLQRYHSVQPKSAPSLWLAIRIEREQNGTKLAQEYGELLTERFSGAPETQLYLESMNHE
ncbi:MAG: type IV pilus biogenesis/stability protein PilW [Gammaproteobacteria bacterium]|nr:type IV pilus biogenesis/stability protein PilW [Gammaproteobacteria bacterium]